MKKPWFPSHQADLRVVLSMLAAALALAAIVSLWRARLGDSSLFAGIFSLTILSIFGLGLAVMASLDFVRSPRPHSGVARFLQVILRIPVFALGVAEVLLWPALLGFALFHLITRQLLEAAFVVGVTLLGIVGTTRYGVEIIRTALKPARTASGEAR